MGRSFAQRTPETELMDTEAISLDDYRACLEDLAKVNALTLTHRPILNWLDRATRSLRPGERVTVLDVGYGYGDLLRRIHTWSRRSHRSVDLVGIDLNPLSETIVRAAASGGRIGAASWMPPDFPLRTPPFDGTCRFVSA